MGSPGVYLSQSLSPGAGGLQTLQLLIASSHGLAGPCLYCLLVSVFTKLESADLSWEPVSEKRSVQVPVHFWLKVTVAVEKEEALTVEEDVGVAKPPAHC